MLDFVVACLARLLFIMWYSTLYFFAGIGYILIKLIPDLGDTSKEYEKCRRDIEARKLYERMRLEYKRKDAA